MSANRYETAQERKLWAEYRADPSIEARNRLVVLYWPMCRMVGRYLSRGKPQNVEPEELAGYAAFRLITHIERFNGEGNFRGYILPHLHRSVLDELRGTDWQKRAARRDEKIIGAATAVLGGRMEEVTADSLAVELDITPGRVEQMLAVIGRTQVGLDYLSADPTDPISRPLVSELAEPSEAADNRAEKEVLEDAVWKLTTTEAQVVYLRDYREMSFAAIGSQLGITEAAVSFRYRNAVHHLQQLFVEAELLEPEGVMESTMDRKRRVTKNRLLRKSG